jgi:hypothetical protein
MQPAHLAWGAGSTSWETQNIQELTFNSEQIQLPQAPVKNVVVAASTGEVLPEYYSVDAITGVITRLNAALPDTVTVTYTADTPQESALTTYLVAEIGRRIVDQIEFCTPEETGTISLSSGRFSISTDPTNHLYYKTTFDYEDASTATIRELGLYIGTIVANDLPTGQRYFTPDQLTDPGILLVNENIPPLIRSVATRESFEFVVTL